MAQNRFQKRKSRQRKDVLKGLQKYFFTKQSLSHTFDHFFRHIWCTSLNHINWELVSAFDNEKLALDIEEELKTKSSPTELEKETIKDVLKNLKNFYEKGNQILTTDNELSESALKILDQVQPISLILVEGITVLNSVPTSKICQLKVNRIKVANYLFFMFSPPKII